MKKEIFIGLDVGTDSVGYAVTDEDYKIVKYKGEPMWGATVFEAANTKAERRSFRTARRRLDRRQQRVKLTQELFAKEIAKIDENFFIRIKESALLEKHRTLKNSYFLFNDTNFTDRDYHKKYPTIHHLICDLMQNDEPKDVRLVYIAIAWLMAHRGHFLNEVDKRNVKNVLDFDKVYDDFYNYFEVPIWETDKNEFKDIMLRKVGISKKEALFNDLLNSGKKFKDGEYDTISRYAVVKLLSGGTIKADKIFLKEEFVVNNPSVSLSMDEESFSAIITEIGDSAELLIRLRAIYDWALLSEILNGCTTISEAKVKAFKQHSTDLKELKKFIRKYVPNKYSEIFRKDGINNYAAYVANGETKKCKKDDFLDYLNKLTKDIVVDEEDKVFYEDMRQRIELKSYLPKQVSGDNRVIPYQLYWDELNTIVENARKYLPFLNETDNEGYVTADKIMSIFEFRIPYYVGPLRTDNSDNSWMIRKADGKIYPWNFDEKVDLDASEEAFINRMTNTCTYLPMEDVIPKCSLLYSKFMVLNEINNIKVNGIDIEVDVKQQIYKKFTENKKVSVKLITAVLKSNGCFRDGDVISGIDQNIKSSLSSYYAFRHLIEDRILCESEVEKIITHITYSEDKQRLKKWLNENYAKLSDADRKYISNMKFKDFGRLSKRFLCELEGVNKETGEVTTIINEMWNTNANLMQLLSDKYTFIKEIENLRNEYYESNDDTIDAMLDSMYISNSVKRPIYRTLAILDDIRKATKTEPKRIFIEMARGGGEKGKRTSSRREQIETLYSNFSKDEVRELSNLLDGKSDNELQSEVLFLYFMQMGKCMYSGEPINIEELKTSKYNVDHIYPQSKIMDDSISNKVLVLSTINGTKGDTYPIASDIRNKMSNYWAYLKNKNMISEEKYKRLMRNTTFSEEELQGFINRQLVESRQSTKALATILQKMYPNTEIVYVKAGIVSKFRKKFDMLKCRSVNDLHHGKDAYLNIVCGNVYHCRFTKNFNVNQKYSINVKTLFTHDVCEGKVKIWDGETGVANVRRVMERNNLHFTRFAFERKGGFFNQLPEKKGSGAVPRKAELSIDEYGGYNNATASFFVMVKYREKKKEDIFILPVELYIADKVMQKEEALMEYAHNSIAKIFGKSKDDIQILGLPLGMRKIKVNTIISLNGMRMAIASKDSGGSRIKLSAMEALKLSASTEQYIKRLEMFVQKRKEKRISKIDEKYDKISREENINVYDVLSDKLTKSKYSVIWKNVGEAIVISKEKFSDMELEEQAELLVNIVGIFRSGRTTGCDLRGIEGKPLAIAVITAKLSTLKKYDDVRLIDSSASGIYETISDNLLELL